MPVSAYLQAAAFIILAGVTLFAAAGTVAILTFWIYLAIFAAIMVAAFIWLDPGLLRERMRPGGKPPPLALRLFTLVMFLHWIVAGLDRGRFHWSDSVPGGFRPWRSSYRRRLRSVFLGDGREPVFLLGRAHPERPRPYVVTRGRTPSSDTRATPPAF